ncbi:peptidase U62 modulator of DNA gyrase [mine drainage metagenome]|uniref:Peptidase U62 modulator of DNA gyrase n=1 Tax=mine drainage metagenome TaxID=410659 RepID=T1DHK5_9ZZZZ
MDQVFSLAEQRLLAPGDLDSAALQRVFAQLMSPQVDAADLYFQHSRAESWMLEDGIVKDGQHSIEQGVGVRAISGEKTGFAYSDDIVLPQLLAARAPRAPSRAAGRATASRWRCASRVGCIRRSTRSTASTPRASWPRCANSMPIAARVMRASSKSS